MSWTFLALATITHDLADTSHVAVLAIISTGGRYGVVARGRVRPTMVAMHMSLTVVELQLRESIADEAEATTAD
jgi:hypothetical protein